LHVYWCDELTVENRQLSSMYSVHGIMTHNSILYVRMF
jgi:hypothetical protein